ITNALFIFLFLQVSCNKDNDEPVFASFSISDTIFNQGTQVIFTDNSKGWPNEYFWEFEGGTPATSTEKNPSTVFAQAGTFNVTLTVIGFSNSSSVTQKVLSMPTEGIAAYYPFNGNANDESGNGHHGTTSGAILSTTDRFDQPNSAYEFDGIDDFINTSTTFDFPNRTLSLWINTYDITGSGSTAKVAITQDDDALNNGILRVDFQNNQMTLWAGGIAGKYVTTSITPNTWTHLVLIREGATTKYYVDNVLEYSSVSDGNGSTLNPVPDFIIGSGRMTQDQFFNGKIDDIRVFNRALNEQEIHALYSGN
ncbi:MAG: PKD domain-containing protein, partial [Cyclobacteriaceae bacterium]|nr:PKD domain-containing protein [Cyclobacteriaceae bacterium]